MRTQQSTDNYSANSYRCRNVTHKPSDRETYPGDFWSRGEAGDVRRNENPSGPEQNKEDRQTPPEVAGDFQDCHGS